MATGRPSGRSDECDMVIETPPTFTGGGVSAYNASDHIDGRKMMVKLLQIVGSGLSWTLSHVGRAAGSFVWNFNHREWFAGILTFVVGAVMLAILFLGFTRQWW